jgi:hypothetical protein
MMNGSGLSLETQHGNRGQLTTMVMLQHLDLDQLRAWYGLDPAKKEGKDDFSQGRVPLSDRAMKY